METRVIIACGGTGGHLFPGLAVARALEARGHNPLLIVSNKQVDQVALESAPDLNARVVACMGWPGLSSAAFKFGLSLLKGWFQVGRIFKEFQPHAVIGMGGFTSALPIERACWARLPTLLHDSNAMPGRVTRMLAKRVTRVLLGFEEAAGRLGNAVDSVVTGTPLNPNVVRRDRVDAAVELGLDAFKPTVLIVGGSQGAKGINQILANAATMLNDEQVAQLQIIHLTGPADEGNVREAYEGRGVKALVYAFNANMGTLYSVADLVVARSGASTLSELSIFGLPSLLIPYPYAADDHQTINGKIFEKAGASRMVKQTELTPERTCEILTDLLLKGEGARMRMAEAALKLGVPDAASRVVDEIEKCTVKN